MKDATHLHWYRCSFCHAVATCPVKVLGDLQCRACRRILAYQWSEAITTPALRERAEHGIVYSAQPAPMKTLPELVRCRAKGCYEYPPKASAIYMPGHGYFCTQEHADDYQREWDAFKERMRVDREQHPSLYPTRKSVTTAQ